MVFAGGCGGVEDTGGFWWWCAEKVLWANSFP